ncbi:hypothetical protein H4R35_007614, partial [Dimargaris xerosporica]
MATAILADPTYQSPTDAYEDGGDSADEFHSAHSQWHDTASVAANPLSPTPTIAPKSPLTATQPPPAEAPTTHPVAKPLLPTYYRYFQQRLFQLSAHVHRTQHLVSLVETKLIPTAFSQALSHRLIQPSPTHGLFSRFFATSRSHHRWWPWGIAAIGPQSMASVPPHTWPASRVGIGARRSTVLARVLHSIRQLMKRLVVTRLRPLWYRLW